jgi:predicted MFS family arabinose efflux permease
MNRMFSVANLRFQLTLLASMQGLLLVNNATLIAINGLAGFQLAEHKIMATLPVTGYVLGGAIWSMPAAAVMRRFGRRAGYTLGSIVAMFGALSGWFAMTRHSLAMLCVATFVCGLYNAFGASLRFAAADVADGYRPDFKARAISLVLTGGIAGGVIGPEVSKWSRDWLPTQFAGSYLTLTGFAFISLLMAQMLRIPVARSQAVDGPARPLGEILRQPNCWVAIVCAALAYGVMNLLMVATPLAMETCRLPYSSIALVLEWHVIGMFGPGLVTGSLIARFGILPIVVIGWLLMLVCVGVALSGVDLMQFIVALLVLGVGWNFVYTGATTLLTTSYQPQEKNKVQGFMDACVFATMISSSASSGALIYVNGWSVLNAMSLPFVIIALTIAVWMARRTGWSMGRSRALATVTGSAPAKG